MKKTNLKFLIVIVILASLTLACNLPLMGSDPEQGIWVSPEYENDLSNDTDSGGTESAAGSIVLTYTQEELTSYLAGQVDLSAYGVSDPRVGLDDGLIRIDGTVEQNLIRLNARVTLRPYLDASNSLQAELVAVDLGPIPAPQNLVNSLSGALDQPIRNLAANLPSDYQLRSIEIADGLMTIVADRI